MLETTKILLHHLNTATIKAAELYSGKPLPSTDQLPVIPEFQAAIDAGINPPALIRVLTIRLGKTPPPQSQ